jgi:glycosyltransferase involved in cell wall biosynthesis
MGVPVIAMQSGGMAELIKDGVTGTLVKEPTPEDLAEKIKETIENEEYYKSLKENLEKENDNIFSVEAYCDILLKEYEKLIKR